MSQEWNQGQPIVVSANYVARITNIVLCVLQIVFAENSHALFVRGER